VIISGAQRQPLFVLTRAGLGRRSGRLEFAPDYASALVMAEGLVAASA